MGIAFESARQMSRSAQLAQSRAITASVRICFHLQTATAANLDLCMRPIFEAIALGHRQACVKRPINGFLS
jgi:hypothetical protein